MPKRVFTDPEKEKAWKEHVKEYNRKYKESPEYQAKIKEFKSREDYKQRQRKYQAKRWRSKKFKKVRESADFKKKQSEYQKKHYSDPEKLHARKEYLADYQKRQDIKDKKNAAKRERRKQCKVFDEGLARFKVWNSFRSRVHRAIIGQVIKKIKYMEETRKQRIALETLAQIARATIARARMQNLRNTIHDIRQEENARYNAKMKKAA